MTTATLLSTPSYLSGNGENETHARALHSVVALSASACKCQVREDFNCVSDLVDNFLRIAVSVNYGTGGISE